MKKFLNILLIAIILVAFTINGYAAKQNINDMAYVVAIRCGCAEVKAI